MNKTAIALVLALATAPYALAEDEERRNHDERLERMRNDLNLSDEQVAQMREIRESDASRWEKRDQMRAVLTEEQLDQMRQHRSQNGGRRGKRPEASTEEYN